MIKNSDVPRSLREFNEVMNAVSYRHGFDNVFCDFLDFGIACFLDTGDKLLADRMKSKYGNDFDGLGKLFRAWIKAQSEMLKSKEWHDSLGEYYEIITSHYKSSALGQFFTPPTIVDLMVGFLLPNLETGAGRTISDPTCGSARLLIAAHAHCPGNYCFGADIDPICVKMSALNMCIHGCEGQIICQDSLKMEWYFGYAVNPYIRQVGVPHLVRIEKHESYEVQMWEARKAQRSAEKEKAEAIAEAQKNKVLEVPKISKGGQLSFI